MKQQEFKEAEYHDIIARDDFLKRFEHTRRGVIKTAWLWGQGLGFGVDDFGVGEYCFLASCGLGLDWVRVSLQGFGYFGLSSFE